MLRNDVEIGPLIEPAERFIGQTLAQFRILGFIGSGASGHVFVAEDTILRRKAAIKVLPHRTARGEITPEVEFLLREARAAAMLDHPHVVRVYSVDQIDGWSFIAMEYVNGQTLAEHVREHGRMAPLEACSLFADAADALAHAHELGIVHRDVKPSNLLLAENGRCKLGDFGMVRFAWDDDCKPLVTEAMGTPNFVAPEVALGYPATPQSDVYSLGASLWFALVGRPPFEVHSADELPDIHRRRKLPKLQSIRPDVSDTAAVAIESALERLPRDRFRSAGEFARALRGDSAAFVKPIVPAGPVVKSSASANVRAVNSTRIHLSVGLWPERLTPKSLVAIPVLLGIGFFGGWICLQAMSQEGETPWSAQPLASGTKANSARAGLEAVSVPTRTQAKADASSTFSLIERQLDSEEIADLKALAALSAAPPLTVTGQIQSVSIGPQGKSVRFLLATTQSNSQVYAECNGTLALSLQQLFGGHLGGGLLGQRVGITAPATVNAAGDLCLKVCMADQIKCLSPLPRASEATRGQSLLEAQIPSP